MMEAVSPVLEFFQRLLGIILIFSMTSLDGLGVFQHDHIIADGKEMSRDFFIFK